MRGKGRTREAGTQISDQKGAPTARGPARPRPRGQCWGPGGAEVPAPRPTPRPPRRPPAPGQVKRGPGSAPGGGAATGVGNGNNSTFIWDCLVLSGWAGCGGGGGQRHLAAHLLLLNPVRAGATAGGLRRTRRRHGGRGGRESQSPRSLTGPGCPGAHGKGRPWQDSGDVPTPLAAPLDLRWPLGHSPRLGNRPPAPARLGREREGEGWLQGLGADSPPPSGRSGKPAFRRPRGGHGLAKGAGRGPGPAGGLRAG